MAWTQYDSFQESLFSQANAIDLDDNLTTTVKVALLTNAYIPDRATHQFWSDVSVSEVTGTNYAAGGNEAGTKTVSTTINVTTFDANDPAAWIQSGTGFSNARYAILYKDTGTPTTSPLIAYHDFGSDVGNVAGDLTVQFDAAGIATIS